MYDLKLLNKQISYDKSLLDKSASFNSTDLHAYLKEKFNMNNPKNYSGKISKLFKNGVIHIEVLNDKDFFMDFINSNPLGKSADYIKRLLYLFDLLTRNKEVNYRNEYANRYSNKPKIKSLKSTKSVKSVKSVNNVKNANKNPFITDEYLNQQIAFLIEQFKLNNNVFTLQSLALLMCYRDIERLRRDFNCEIINDNRSREKLKDKNFFDLSSKKFHLNKFKNDKTLPKSTYDISDELVDYLQLLIQMKKELGFKQPNFLLHNKQKNILNKDAYSTLLSELLHTNKPIVKLRKGKVWETRQKYADDKKTQLKELIKLSKRMKHSTKTQLEYYTEHQDEAEKWYQDFLNGKDSENMQIKNSIDTKRYAFNFDLEVYDENEIDELKLSDKEKLEIIDFVKKQLGIENLKNNKKLKIECECGSFINKNYIKRHLQTNKHLKHQNKNNKSNNH